MVNSSSSCSSSREKSGFSLPRREGFSCVVGSTLNVFCEQDAINSNNVDHYLGNPYYCYLLPAFSSRTGEVSNGQILKEEATKAK